MATSIVIPTLGESISEAVVASWLKPDGSYVKRDEEIVELETDKVTMPLPAPAAGVLRHTASQGDTVPVGGVVGSIDESAAPPPQGAVEPKTPVAEVPKSKAVLSGVAAAPAAAHAPAAGEVRATPLARKVAEEHHIDLARVPATGPGGRVRQQDVLAFGQGDAGAQQAAPVEAGVRPRGAGDRAVSRERMSQLRQRIAARLVEAQHTAAMLTTFNECDMTRVMDVRTRFKDAFEKKHGVKLGFMSFFVKAAVSALQKFPLVNASIVDGDKGPEVEFHHYQDIAVAVGTEKGLVVPVLRDCQALSFAGVETGINTLAARARDNKLTLEDLQGGTFTISNGGVYGSMMSTPILNPPQSGILGMHNIIRRPVEHPEKPGSNEVVVRPMMYLALSYDHRIVDGAGAVGFLKHIKECIEDPQRLLLEV